MQDPFIEERKQMVENQLRGRGLNDERLLGAFRQVPRHEFIPAHSVELAYRDCAVAIGHGQTISQPYMVACMTRLAQIEPGQKVLEIGTGSGYQAAILAELGARVFSVERLSRLSARAQMTLSRLGYSQIRFRIGDGTEGWSEWAPYDAIIVTAGAPKLPDPLLQQLDLEGRLIIPVEEDFAQVLYIVRRRGTEFITERGERCTFVPLIGKHGWKS